MDCSGIRSDLVTYLYGDADCRRTPQIEEHLAHCRACAQELAELRQVQRVLDSSEPSVWYEPASPVVRPWYRKMVLPLAATVLLGIGIGIGWNLKIKEPVRDSAVTVASPPSRLSEQQEILETVAQNYSYRMSLALGQAILWRKMETQLGAMAGVDEQIQRFHAIEASRQMSDLTRTVALQQEFLQQYRHTPLAGTVRLLLAEDLLQAKKFQESIAVYQIILAHQHLTPQERGMCIWQMAHGYKSDDQLSDYQKLLEELAGNTSYGMFRAKAAKILADADFSKCRFFQARTRYRQYLESNLPESESEEAGRRILWIDFHEQDDCYPLTLYVQAQNRGREALYGVNIILSDYPDSPLALPALELYLQNSGSTPAASGNKFPTTKNPRLLLAYLASVTEVEENKIIVAFCRYSMGRLWEELGKEQQALVIYEQAARIKASDRLEAVALAAAAHLKNKVSLHFYNRISVKNERKDL